MNLKSIIPWKKEDRLAVRISDEADPFLQIQRQTDRVFVDLLGRSYFDNGKDFAPKLDVSDTDTEVRISAEIPGLDRKDVDVELSGGILTIKGEKRAEHASSKSNYWYHERSYGYFSRSVQLPPNLNHKKAKTNFRKGVLTITIPKKIAALAIPNKIELLENN